METLFDWMRVHGVLELAWVVGVASFVLSLVGLPLLVAAVPVDYFEHERPPALAWSSRHPLGRALLLALKNVLGLVVLLSGVAMLVLPGQGVLMILVGLSLVSFPGKRRLELAIVRRKSVSKALAWIRRRTGKEPLRVWDPRRTDQASAKS